MEWQLTAEYRAKTGKNIARKLRNSDKIPGILYGHRIDGAVPVSVDYRDILKLLSSMGEETKVIQLTLRKESKEEKHQVLIREVQVHPFKRRLLHVDFYALAADQLLDVEVPIELVGESPGVKKGAVVEHILHTLSVRCLPHEIPEKIEIDISDLDIGDVIHISDIRGRYPFRIMDDDEAPIVSIKIVEDYEEKASESEESSE
ncbi:MAG: 50S ribosomal protein L25/general stress protein Ctc [Syntrophobacterales bacterium]|nr:50S ribosomal protein L25/general stress protein Ctc [Syntrophobacterales bacterium]